jgi:1-phosphofructokinase family hexose kinase
VVILAAGLSPAWQQVLVFDAFTPGAVNRARQVHWCASGKVLNAARALHHLGGPVRALTVVGGLSGEAIRRDFAQLGAAARWVETAAPTRTCTTILDSARHTATELVPEAEPITAEELHAFLAAFAEEAAASAVVVLIGSLPAGTPSTCYRDMVRATRGPVILDARGAELLEALPAKPFLVKPNRDELGRTLGRDLPDDRALFEAMRELNQRGAEWVMITEGKSPVYASTADRLYRLQPPPAVVVNPIGCGDCMAAGIAWALHHGRDPLDALRHGVAAATDKLGRLVPGVVDRTRVEALAGSIEVARL